MDLLKITEIGQKFGYEGQALRNCAEEEQRQYALEEAIQDQEYVYWKHSYVQRELEDAEQDYQHAQGHRQRTSELDQKLLRCEDERCQNDH